MVCIAVDYATNDTITADSIPPEIPENTVVLNGTFYTTANDSGIAKVNNVVTNKAAKKKLLLVTITAKPSCGCRHSYTWHTRTYVNYCPYCRKYGTLTNLHKRQARFEQEISCRRCSSDWCRKKKKEKYSWSHKYLRKV